MFRISDLITAVLSFLVLLYVFSLTNLDPELVALYAIIGAVVVTLIKFFIERYFEEQERQRIAQAQADELRYEDAIRARERMIEAERARERVQEIQSRANSRPIYLYKLELIIEDEKRSLRVGKVINPKTDRYVRPVAQFILNEVSAVGKALPLEFNLVGPRGDVQFSYKTVYALKKGDNTVYTSTAQFELRRNMQEGKYKIRLWAGDREWGENTFVVTTQDLADAGSELIGADLELKPGAERLAEQIASVTTTSIDDLLG